MEAVPVMIYTEATPNPATLKFVVNRPLLPNDFVDFQEVVEAIEAPLATQLFALPGVCGIFISNNFVTITKAESVMWAELMIPAKNTIRDYIESEKPLFTDSFVKPSRQATNNIQDGDSDVEIRIKGALDKYVKPAVEMDGGSISFVSFDNGLLTLQLQGSCSGCPSSTVTLKQGIENLMKRFVPEVQDVVAEAE